MTKGWLNDDFDVPGELTVPYVHNSGSGVAAELKKNCFYSNLDITYSSSTLSVTGQGGTALSSTNPGYVGITSNTSGQTVQIPVTANQGFIDDTGSSEIINNLFGLTTGVAYGSDIPFYGYAVLNDAENAVAFMCSRTPGMTQSPAVGEIGAPDDAVADEQYSFFSFESIDETLYDTNPCVMLFSFRMTMSASDDWTVSALNDGDGFGKFQENKLFVMPTGTFGNETGKLLSNNGGTAPEFNTETFKYTVDPFNQVATYTIICFGDGGTDGSGVVETWMYTPYKMRSNSEATYEYVGAILVQGGGAPAEVGLGEIRAVNGQYIGFWQATFGTVNNADFTNGSRGLRGRINVNIWDGVS